MSSTKPPLDELRIERSDEREPESKPWRAVAAAVIMVLVLALVAFAWHSRSGAIEVHTAVARETGGAGGDHTVLNASGYVTARRAATVSSKVTGKVVEVLIEEGMKVKEGQVVARLDDTNVQTSLAVAQAQLASAKAALDETRAQLKQADQEFQRITELAKQKIASQSDLDVAEANAKSLAGAPRPAASGRDRRGTKRGHVGTEPGRHDHPRAFRRRRHHQGRPAGRDDFTGIGRRRLHPHRHRHRRGHGIAGNRN